MLALALCLCTPPVIDAPERIPAPQPPASNIAGVYAIVPSPDSNIRGTATITKTGDLYYVQWAITAETAKGVRASVTQGVGVRKGDVLAVSWREGDALGVTLYRIDGRRLTGWWVVSPGNGAAQVEVLQWLARVPRID